MKRWPVYNTTRTFRLGFLKFTDSEHALLNKTGRVMRKYNVNGKTDVPIEFMYHLYNHRFPYFVTSFPQWCLEKLDSFECAKDNFIDNASETAFNLEKVNNANQVLGMRVSSSRKGNNFGRTRS